MNLFRDAIAGFCDSITFQKTKGQNDAPRTQLTFQKCPASRNSVGSTSPTSDGLFCHTAHRPR